MIFTPKSKPNEYYGSLRKHFFPMFAVIDCTNAGIAALLLLFRFGDVISTETTSSSCSNIIYYYYYFFFFFRQRIDKQTAPINQTNNNNMCTTYTTRRTQKRHGITIVYQIVFKFCFIDTFLRVRQRRYFITIIFTPIPNENLRIKRFPIFSLATATCPVIFN